MPQDYVHSLYHIYHHFYQNLQVFGVLRVHAHVQQFDLHPFRPEYKSVIVSHHPVSQPQKQRVGLATEDTRQYLYCYRQTSCIKTFL